MSTAATLPIPAQPGFRVRLPPCTRFAPGVRVHPAEQGLTLARNESTIAISLVPTARDVLLAALDESGAGLPTDGLAPTWRRLLERLAANGMLVDPAPGRNIAAVDALVALNDRIYQETRVCFPPGNAVDRLIAGSSSTASALAWLTENYRYTKSASHHITPVLQHPMEQQERHLWLRLLKDESWHWRIYRPALGQFGLSFRELDSRQPRPSTTSFVETLHSIADESAVAYAAAMIFIEKPPTSADLDSDPLYTSLMANYGFTAAAVGPLWWHATENMTAGHSALGAVVITNRGRISRRELDAALGAVHDTIRAVSAWHEDLLADS